LAQFTRMASRNGVVALPEVATTTEQSSSSSSNYHAYQVSCHVAHNVRRDSSVAYSALWFVKNLLKRMGMGLIASTAAAVSMPVAFAAPESAVAERPTSEVVPPSAFRCSFHGMQG
jgi:hypothetical protein